MITILPKIIFLQLKIWAKRRSSTTLSDYPITEYELEDLAGTIAINIMKKYTLHAKVRRIK